MEHSYIDQHSIAERYLEDGLAAGEREAFERHLVDCQECTDRILLAGMFHARLHGRPQEPGHTNGSGAAPEAGAHPSQAIEAKPSRPPGLVLRIKPLQIVWIVVISLLLLSAIPILVWLVLPRLGPG